MGQSLNLAVVGCGLGGLTAACLLRDQGHKVTIFDQFDTPAPVGSGLIIQPVGQDVLAQLGVLSAAIGHGVKISDLTGQSEPGGVTALKASYGSGRFGLAIHRGTLFEVLLTAARARGVEIEAGSFVLDADEDFGAPYLRIEGGREAGPFDLVVDAGGAGSPLSPLVSRPLPYGALWGVVDLPDGERDLGGVLRQRYVAAHKMAGVLPIGTLPGDPTPKAAIFWSLRHDAYPDWRAADIEDWHAEISDLWPDFGYLAEPIRSHDDLTFAAYCHGSLFRPWTKSVFHIGDAAHQASPQLGQGANMALLDASALAHALEPGLRGARRRYVAQRFAHVRIYQGLSAAFTPLYQSNWRWLGGLRDKVLTPVSARPWPAKVITRVICGDLVPPYGFAKRAPVPEVAGSALHEPGE